MLGLYGVTRDLFIQMFYDQWLIYFHLWYIIELGALYFASPEIFCALLTAFTSLKLSYTMIMASNLNSWNVATVVFFVMAEKLYNQTFVTVKRIHSVHRYRFLIYSISAFSISVLESFEIVLNSKIKRIL